MTTRPTEDEIRAEPAGRRLDAWVHSIVVGKIVYEQPDLDWLDHGEIPSYSTSWSAAGPLLESIEPLGWRIDNYASDVVIWYGKSSIEAVDVYYCRAKPNDICRAICIARILTTIKGTNNRE